MDTVKLLMEEIDQCIKQEFGSDVKIIDAWLSDSELSFTVTYNLNKLNIEIWRDRGLFTASLSKSDSTTFHSIAIIAEHLHDKNHESIAVTNPRELTSEFLYIKNKYNEITVLLKTQNIESDVSIKNA